MVELIKNLEAIKSELSFSYINNFEKEFSKFNYKNIRLQELQDLCAISKYELKRLMCRSKISIDKKANGIDDYISEFLEFTIENINNNYNKEKTNQYAMDFKNIINNMKIYEKLSEINFAIKEV